jgi:hypothetical protein
MACPYLDVFYLTKLAKWRFLKSQRLVYSLYKGTRYRTLRYLDIFYLTKLAKLLVQ